MDIWKYQAYDVLGVGYDAECDETLERWGSTLQIRLDSEINWINFD